MGGRIASQVVAAGDLADGLLLLSYPLHPAGRPETLRDRHLPGIKIPALFVQGSRDALARLDLMEAALGRLGSPASLHVVEGGDHSFAVLKRSGRSEDEVAAEIAKVVAGWLDRHGL